MTGVTISECLETMRIATEQDARGERPGIVPENAVKNNGIWSWEDNGMCYSWFAGAPAISCWSKDIYVTSKMQNK